jgi:hypothetical protein
MVRTGVSTLRTPGSSGQTTTASGPSRPALYSAATPGCVSGLIWLLVIAAPAAGCGGGEEVVDLGPKRPVAVDQPPPEKKLNEIYAQTAESYYALMRALKEHDRKAAHKSSQAEISRRQKPLPRNATGMVVDRMNVVVPGASIMVSHGAENNVIGRAKTDEQGRFRAELFATSYRDLTLHVVAEGYAKWIRDRIYGGIQDWVVRLDQNVSQHFLEKLSVTQKPEDRLWMLLEIVGARRFPVKVEDVFPHLGVYRTDLLRVIATRGFHEKDDETSSPAQRALELLSYWHEPADIPMIHERLPKTGYTLFKKVVIFGKSPSEVCRMWADAHFAQTEIDPRPPAKCSKPRYSPDRRRALAVFAVFEPYATYRHLLAMIDYGNGWELRLVKTGK